MPHFIVIEVYKLSQENERSFRGSGIKSNLILQKLPSLHNKIEKIIITRRTCRTYSSEIN
jgi:hypothetical protein